MIKTLSIWKFLITLAIHSSLLDCDHKILCDRLIWEKKGRDLTQSYDKSPYIHKKKSIKQRDNTKTPPKTSIKQRLQTDLGRSVGVTTAN